ncbi:MAG: hypothetical protein CMJ94_06090 [Planctomycetes bacterium]|nr:hypothetical protein [Planctomycetota bacterium]
MARILPLVLPRTAGAWCLPHAAERFPCARPRFALGDPRDLVPQTCELLAEQGCALLPWGAEDGDLLLAPAPRPGEEASVLLELLAPLDQNFPILLYRRESPFLANLDVEGEALTLLPAQRLSLLLRGSAWAERRPGPRGSLQNRVFLSLALDLWRSALLLADYEEHSRQVGEIRLEGELDLLPEAHGAELLRLGSKASFWAQPCPSRVHLPWWAGCNARAWQINRQARRTWPRAWGEVEVQVRLGTRYRRISARAYFEAFRRSGSARRLLLGS